MVRLGGQHGKVATQQTAGTEKLLQREGCPCLHEERTGRPPPSLCGENSASVFEYGLKRKRRVVYNKLSQKTIKEVVLLQPAYKRILLKLSGEALSNNAQDGRCIDGSFLTALCEKIAQITKLGVQVAVVCGGGNIWRGRTVPEMDRTRADQSGMMATIINGLALEDALIRQGVQAVLLTAFEVGPVGRRYTVVEAERILNEGGVAVLAGGTGHPFFTTDSGAALRAAELQVDAILMAKTIDGVYTADPKKDSSAVFLPEITCTEALYRRLGVMDATAMALCMDNHITIRVFAMSPLDNLMKVVCGEPIGSVVTG
ncbi:MAG: UMP kinase [Clostridia bacterium]|nr:UMP kinase [Clostridia bacterium]